MDDNNLDELLKLLEEESSNNTNKIQTSKKETDFESFILQYNIKDGETPIKIKLLHYYFLKVAKKKSTFIDFVDNCIIHFKKVKDKTFVYLNKDESLFLSMIRDNEENQKQQSNFNSFTFENELLYKKFLKKYEIKPGDAYIEGDLLFYIFTIFAKLKKTKTKKDDFFNYMNLQFKTTNIGLDTIWYAVDPEIKKKIARETIKQWRMDKGISYEKFKKEKENITIEITEDNLIKEKEVSEKQE